MDLNGTQAAIRAGYSARTANEQAARLLAKASISAAVAVGQAKRLARLEITQDRVLQEIASLAFSDVRQWFDETGRLRPIPELPDRVAAAVGSIEVQREKTTRKTTEAEEVTVEECVVKLKAWDKGRALELLAKHFGLVREQIEHTGAVKVTFGGRYKPQ